MAPIFESNFSIRNIIGDNTSNIQQNIKAENNAPLTPPRSDGSASPDCSGSEDSEERPGFTFSAMVAMAIRSSPEKRLPLSAIQDWISDNFPYFRKDQHGWQSQVRHTLSTNSCFIKVPRPLDDPGRGNYWAINPAIEDVNVNTSTGRLVIDPNGGQFSANGYGHPLNQVITHGVPMNHPQSPNAIYFPTPEELGRAQQALMVQAMQEQQMWFLHHQQQQQIIQQELMKMQQQQFQQQYIQLQQKMLFHQQQCEFMLAKQLPM
ncbi:PREDICTED: fork head domain transcription factor slp1-like [Rhagoletis zephyria]|uniref:fork head domain transcription factor slp1-like n=1 Tax=Rhagoletis zephyria TaxID=28612 RepID=UPI000811702E|nr:PREDICTED: fork head domain transcription factor slp1-like [Rhagoletis zephyria]